LELPATHEVDEQMRELTAMMRMKVKSFREIVVPRYWWYAWNMEIEELRKSSQIAAQHPCSAALPFTCLR
jgi:hypothetical protein